MDAKSKKAFSSFVPRSSSFGFLVGVPAIFVLAYLYPALPYVSNFETCALVRFLKIPCPGCGLTRSFTAITHGDIPASISAHPLGIVVALWLGYLFLRSVLTVFAGRQPREILTQKQRDWLLGLFVVAMFAKWIFILIRRFS